MFNLIISIAAIVLVVGLTVVTLYHGGNEVLTRGKEESVVAKSISEVTQMRSAIMTYKARFSGEPALADLISSGILKTLPPGWSGDPLEFSAQPGFAFKALSLSSEAESLSACMAVNANMGLTDVPMCDAMNAGFSGCCQVP